jgi:hypothetical protein
MVPFLDQKHPRDRAKVQFLQKRYRSTIPAVAEFLHNLDMEHNEGRPTSPAATPEERIRRAAHFQRLEDDLIRCVHGDPAYGSYTISQREKARKAAAERAVIDAYLGVRQ